MYIVEAAIRQCYKETIVVATVCIVWVSTIMQRLCFLFCASICIMLRSYLASAYISYYATVYCTVFGAMLSIHIEGVGWTKKIVT